MIDMYTGFHAELIVELLSLLGGMRGCPTLGEVLPPERARRNLDVQRNLLPIWKDSPS